MGFQRYRVDDALVAGFPGTEYTMQWGSYLGVSRALGVGAARKEEPRRTSPTGTRGGGDFAPHPAACKKWSWWGRG